MRPVDEADKQAPAGLAEVGLERPKELLALFWRRRRQAAMSTLATAAKAGRSTASSIKGRSSCRLSPQDTSSETIPTWPLVVMQRGPLARFLLPAASVPPMSAVCWPASGAQSRNPQERRDEAAQSTRDCLLCVAAVCSFSAVCWPAPAPLARSFDGRRDGAAWSARCCRPVAALCSALPFCPTIRPPLSQPP